MNQDNHRITKLKEYLFNIVKDMTFIKSINVNALGNTINNYSLDKIPTSSTVESWVLGHGKNKDVYSFKSVRNYSYDELNNSLNVAFFEEFEKIIFNNNKKKILPEIEGIQKIECLNCGTLISNETNTATFEIQIQIEYIY